jgi:type IV secretion system protein VirD4
MKIDKRLLQDYENKELLRYSDSDERLSWVAYDDLPNLSLPGVLKASKHIDGKLMQLYTDQPQHVSVIAATRLGKTTSVVIPTIFSYAKQKVKKNMIITDPKGEIYRITASTLRDEGYIIKLLNFRNYKKSECWNPLTPIFRKYKAVNNIYDEVEVVDDNGVLKNKFRGRVYDSQVQLDYDINVERAMLLDDVECDIDRFANMVIVTITDRDPTWEDGARDLLRAFLYAMLEDSDKEENPITEETFSLSTIFRIESQFKNKCSEYDDCGYFSKRGADSKAYQLAKNIILDTASGTRSSYVSVFVAKLSEYREVTTRVITSCNTFDIGELAECGKPVAIFIDFKDELKSQFSTISLFVQDAYRVLIEEANKTENGKLDVPWVFILDEFGNFTKIKDMETVISACAGRNIWFTLIVQSYAQLENVYGSDCAEIIRDNMNVHIFMGSNNPSTLDEFSRECGKMTRVSPLSALNGQGTDIDNYQLETIPLMPNSRLSHLGVGECILTEANSGYVLYSMFERYYMCEEFSSLPKESEDDYICTINPFDSKYIYNLTGSDNGNDGKLF